MLEFLYYKINNECDWLMKLLVSIGNFLDLNVNNLLNWSLIDYDFKRFFFVFFQTTTWTSCMGKSTHHIFSLFRMRLPRSRCLAWFVGFKWDPFSVVFTSLPEVCSPIVAPVCHSVRKADGQSHDGYDTTQNRHRQARI